MDAINANFNQYTRPGGNLDYVKVLADLYSPLYDHALDPMKEIVTFNGAQEGIAMILAALVEPVRFSFSIIDRQTLICYVCRETKW